MQGCDPTAAPALLIFKRFGYLQLAMSPAFLDALEQTGFDPKASSGRPPRDRRDAPKYA